jgi:hypothetical protein
MAAIFAGDGEGDWLSLAVLGVSPADVYFPLHNATGHA